MALSRPITRGSCWIGGDHLRAILGQEDAQYVAVNDSPQSRCCDGGNARNRRHGLDRLTTSDFELTRAFWL